MLSRSVYQDVGDVANLKVGSNLPDSKNGTTPYKANATGVYPTVFNNASVDGSFGVTSPIFLDQLTTSGAVVNTLAIPTSQLVTSFPSKSELGLNLSTNGTSLTFMGYGAPVGALDISNTNTPGITEPGNYVTAPATYREVAQVSTTGALQVTTTNAYDGNNGRAAILDNTHNQYFTVGNAGNGNGDANTTSATGVQIVIPGQNATASTPGTTKVGHFNAGSYGVTDNKPAKDDNYRGETIFNNTLYTTKGSGSNGIDTVYQVGAAGSLPTTANAATAPIIVLPGFSTAAAKTNANTPTTNFHPFGLFFANASTLYVADEGDGTAANAGTTNDPHAGLDKYSLVGGSWQLDYALNSGLNLGTQYSVGGYTAATDGLRNITGKVNTDGTVSIYGITSTVSSSGDQGAAPNKLVAISDLLSNTTSVPLPTEQFSTLDSANYGEVLRGISFAPTDVSPAPEPSETATMGLTLFGVIGLIIRKRKSAKSQA